MNKITPNPAAETPEFMQRTDKQFFHQFVFSFLNTIMWDYRNTDLESDTALCVFLTYHKPQAPI
jgi:hypothetical protein